MLTITDEAASAIDRILAVREMPDHAGIRITAGPSGAGDGSEGVGVRMEVTPAPADGDEVLEKAPVFLEAETAQLLDHKLLDAEVSPDGTQFTLHEQ
jgi:Fe-S cluster assembly iron-binding protein IscA